MTDDKELNARLRDAKRDWPEFGHDRAEAADRIEALSAARDTMGNLWAREKERSERLQKGMLEAIGVAEQPHYGDRGDALDHCFEAIDVLRATLAEISSHNKGESQ